MTKKKAINVIFAVVRDKTDFIGYYDTFSQAKDEIEEHQVDEAEIIEISRVWGVYFPEEPDLEHYEKKLVDVLDE